MAQRLSSEAIEAWRLCSLKRALGPHADDLLVNASEVLVAPGEVYYHVTNGNLPTLCVVVSGLTRVYTTSSQGRQMTIRYAGPGSAIGLPVLLMPSDMPAYSLGVQALTTCKLLSLSPQRFRALATSESLNLWPLCTELARLLVDDCRLLSRNLFQPVRARVARHLLDLSYKANDSLVVSATQQDVADAIGSVRAVVSRVIVELKKDGLIRREQNLYVIADPARLYALSEEEIE